MCAPVSLHLTPACLQELLLPLVTDTDISMEISGFAALALGLVFTSTCKEVCVCVRGEGGFSDTYKEAHTGTTQAIVWGSY